VVPYLIKDDHMAVKYIITLTEEEL